MKKSILIATSTLLSFFIANVHAVTIIHADKNSASTPKVHWLSRNSIDTIEISTDGAPYNLLISADAMINNNSACNVDIYGCQSVAELEPGDSAMCVPTTGAVFLTSQCDPEPFPNAATAAGGTVQFVKSKSH